MTKRQNQCAQDFKARNNLNNYINFYHFSFSSAFTFESRWLNITPALQLGLLLFGWYHRCMRTLSLFIRDCCLFLLSLKHKTVLKIWLWGTSQMFCGFFCTYNSELYHWWYKSCLEWNNTWPLSIGHVPMTCETQTKNVILQGYDEYKNTKNLELQ